jgi:hypothetical protein
VKEAMQVLREVEVSLAEFFAEDITQPTLDPLVGAADSVSLVQRTTGLERLVTNFATLLDVLRGSIKVICVHKPGEPCISNELMSLLGSFHQGDRRRRAAGAGAGAYQIELEVTGANTVEETGDGAKDAANTQFLAAVHARFQALARPTAGSNATSALELGLSAGVVGLLAIKGVGVEPNFGVGATSGDAPASSLVLGSFRDEPDSATTTTAAAEATTEAVTTEAAAEGDGTTDNSSKSSAGAAVGISLALVFVALIGVGYLVHRKIAEASAKDAASAKELAAQERGGFSLATAGVGFTAMRSPPIELVVRRPQEGSAPPVTRAQEQRDSILDEFDALGPSLASDGHSLHGSRRPSIAAGAERLPFLRLGDPHAHTSWEEPQFVPSGARQERRPSTVSMV